MGQLAQERSKDKLLADIQSVSIAGATIRGMWVKEEHDLHTNVCKMGVAHKSMAVQK